MKVGHMMMFFMSNVTLDNTVEMHSTWRAEPEVRLAGGVASSALISEDMMSL